MKAMIRHVNISKTRRILFCEA